MEAQNRKQKYKPRKYCLANKMSEWFIKCLRINAEKGKATKKKSRKIRIFLEILTRFLLITYHILYCSFHKFFNIECTKTFQKFFHCSFFQRSF